MPTTTGRGFGGIDELVLDVGSGHDVRVAQLSQHGLVVGNGRVDRVDQDDGGFLARVVAALVDGKVEQLGVSDAKAGQDGVAQGGIGVVQGEFEFVNTQHGSGC